MGFGQISHTDVFLKHQQVLLYIFVIIFYDLFCFLRRWQQAFLPICAVTVMKRTKNERLFQILRLWEFKE